MLFSVLVRTTWGFIHRASLLTFFSEPTAGRRQENFEKVRAMSGIGELIEHFLSSPIQSRFKFSNRSIGQHGRRTGGDFYVEPARTRRDAVVSMSKEAQDRNRRVERLTPKESLNED